MNNQAAYTSVFPWFVSQVQEHGNDDALIVYEDEYHHNINYKDLYAQTIRAASVLVEKNPTRMQVAILCKDAINQAILILAAMAARIPFIIFDVKSSPTSRIENNLSKEYYIYTDIINFNLYDTFVKGIIYYSYLDKSTIKKNSVDSNYAEDGGDGPLYIAQTSGSTGKSKRITIWHRGIINYITWRNKAYQIQSGDHILQLLSPAFDGFLSNFFSALLAGATLVFCDYKKVRQPLKVFTQERITQLSVTPSILAFFVEQATENDFKFLRHVVLGGEKCPEFILESLFNLCPGIKVANEYGMAENCIATTANENLTLKDINNIGKSIHGTEVHILDGFQQPVPVGSAGEVYVGGIGLANGYMEDDELTKHHFMHIPSISKNRLYRTGDYCMVLPDGSHRFLYRKDRQINVNGCRVELDEIAHIIQSIDEVIAAYVFYETSENTKPVLEAFLRIKSPLTYEEIQMRLKDLLMPYMIPQVIYQINDSWSDVTKANRKDLLLISQNMNPAVNFSHEYSDHIEEDIYKMWNDILEHKMFSNKSNFFDVGGNSYLVTMLYTKIVKAYNIHLSVMDLYRNNCILDQVKLVNERLSENGAIQCSR